MFATEAQYMAGHVETHAYKEIVSNIQYAFKKCLIEPSAYQMQDQMVLSTFNENWLPKANLSVVLMADKAAAANYPQFALKLKQHWISSSIC